MTTYKFGDIILVPFPFTDQTNTKKRPAVVASSKKYNIDRPISSLWPSPAAYTRWKNWVKVWFMIGKKQD